MQTIIYKKWNICNAYNKQGAEYWTVWTPNMLDLVSEDFKSISKAKNWIDNNNIKKVA